MKKCDVCGKTTLLPEKFSEVYVCKICFLKVSGPFWKHSYDRYEDAEKHRNRALEAAHKESFPQSVLTAINGYFKAQIEAMTKCNCCDHPVSALYPVGETAICKKCFNKINSSAWRETEYLSNEDVEKNRQKTLKVATKNDFPSIVIEGINHHFNSKLQDGLIRIVHSSKRQTLKVYETYSILETEEYFNAEERSKEYAKVLKKNQPKENHLSGHIAKTLARGVLTGGFIKAGLSLATSVAIDAAVDRLSPDKAIFKVVKGSCKINYQVYDRVQFQESIDDDIGYIRFRSSQYNNDPSEDLVFFFSSNSGKEELFNRITQCIEEVRCEQLSKQASTSSVESTLSLQSTIADEILKFKKLLDIGAITQDEFDKKKKELLDM